MGWSCKEKWLGPRVRRRPDVIAEPEPRLPSAGQPIRRPAGGAGGGVPGATGRPAHP